MTRRNVIGMREFQGFLRPAVRNLYAYNVRHDSATCSLDPALDKQASNKIEKEKSPAAETSFLANTHDRVNVPHREFMCVSDIHVVEYIKHLQRISPHRPPVSDKGSITSEKLVSGLKGLSNTKEKDDLAPLQEILPGVVEGLETSYRFQERVIILQKQRGVEVAAWRTSAVTRINQKQWDVNEPLHAPVFATCAYKEGDDMSIGQHRIQTCELAFAFRIAKRIDLDFLFKSDSEPKVAERGVRRSKVDSFPKVQTSILLDHVDYFYPALDFSGTRFPHRAPHGVAFVADMSGVAAVALGLAVPAEKWKDHDMSTYPCVLFLEDEPIQTGRGDNVLGNPLNSILHLATNFYYMRDKRYLEPGNVVLTGGCGQQANIIRTGKLTAHFGPLGKVSVTMVP